MKTLVLTAISISLAAGLAVSAEEQGSFDRSLTVSGPVELDIMTDAGGILVTPGSSGSLHVHAILKAQHGWFDSGNVAARIRELEQHPPIEQTGNRVRLGYVRDRNLLKGVSMRLEIQAPPDTQLRAHADSGGIHVEGIHGPADCRTDSGGIEMRDIDSDIHAVTDSGGIHINHINGSVFARADSGGIDAWDVAGGIDAGTDSGGIRLGQTKPAPIHAKADSGGATVRLAANAGYDIQAESESGRISVPEMTVRGAFSRHRIKGQVRGGGPLVHISVDSGNITIE